MKGKLLRAYGRHDRIFWGGVLLGGRHGGLRI